ncbi:MAG: SLBB domain-containing protein, partial [Gemmatimonadota bacterium]
LKPGEGLRALIAMAGGFEPAADVRRVQIDRILPPEARAPGVFRRLLDVSVEELLRGEAGAPIPLEAGDRVTVYAVPTEQRDRVTLVGNVWKPGEYELGAGLTLWQLVERAGGLRDETYRGRAHIARLNKADLTRRILPVTLATASDGAPLDDPPLEEYDVVTVYAVSDFVPERFVSISGEVQDGGVFPYRERMTLRDLVLQAGGFREGAYLVEAEVSRIVEEPGTGRARTEVMSVPLDSTYAVSERARARTPAGFDGLNGDGAAKAPEVYLERYDNVFIRRKPNWELQRNVVVTGEVVFPGEYSLEGKEERLASVIRRAGGLTEQAYPDGVRFYRRRGDAGRVGINLAAAVRDPRHGDNVTLQPGDSIHVPQYLPTVRVEGAVLAPVSALYRRGAGLGHYIEQAGGYAPNADEGRVHVRYANGDVDKVGRFLFFRTAPSPDPGSVVIVPVKPETEPTNWGAVVRDVVSVGLTAATLIIAIDRN